MPIKSKLKSEQGSMALVFFLILATGALSVLVLSILTWQIGQVKNEQTLRDSQIALDSAMNLAAESVGSSGRGLIGVNMIPEPTWNDSQLDGIVSRWWAVPVNGRDTAKIPTPETFAYMTSNNNLTVAISFTNLVYVSTDGISWINTGKSPLPYTEISDFTYGKSSFLITARPNAESANSLFYHSTDGKNWNAAPVFKPSPLGSEKVSRIACSPAQCIILTSNPGVSSRYWVSTNLSNWSLSRNSATTPGTHLATEIAYGGNRFLAVSYNGVQSVSSFSTDGSTWSGMTNFPSSGLAITDLEYVGTNFVGVATGTSDTLFYKSRVANFGTVDTSQIALTSPDGLTWTNTPLPISQRWSNLISDGTRAVLLAESSSLSVLGGTPTFLATANGTNWTSRTLPLSGSYVNGAILRNSTIITSPYSTEGFVAADDASRAALPLEIYVRGQAKSVNFTGDTVLESVYKFSWNSMASGWELIDAFNELDFSLKAKYTVSPVSGAVTMVNGQAQLVFTDTSEGSPSSRYWDFGDGTSSTAQNPAKTYTQAGIYTVRLTVYEPGGYSSTYSLNISVQTFASAPRDVTVKSDGRALIVAWRAPLNDGASPVAYYKVRYRAINTVTWIETPLEPSILNARLSNLSALGGDTQIEYEIQVAAVAAVGTGAWSATSNQVPLSTPTAPRNLTLTGLLDMSVGWVAPLNTGGSPIIGYRLQTATNPSFTANVTVVDLLSSPATISYLNENTTYYTRLFAINAVGLSVPSNVVIRTTIGRASAPTFFGASPFEDVIRLSWRVPLTTGNLPILGYEVSSTLVEGDFDLGSTVLLSNSTFLYNLQTLPGETYFVRVRAITQAGGGNYTQTIQIASNIVPFNIAGLLAVPGSKSVLFSWNPINSTSSGGGLLDGDLTGRTLSPGTYTAGAAISLTGTLTLNAGGDPNAVFLFKIDAALNLAATGKIVLVNGGSIANVFWQVGGAINLGAGSEFLGTGITIAPITAGAGSKISGKLFSTVGAITLASNVIESYEMVRTWSNASIINLGAASTYSVFAGGVLSHTGTSSVIGDMGSAKLGFAGVAGIAHTGQLNLGNEAAMNVQADLITAYNNALNATSLSPVLSYRFTWFSANGTKNTVTLPGSATSLNINSEDITGDGIADGPLTTGRTYIFTIRVTNAVGFKDFIVSSVPGA